MLMPCGHVICKESLDRISKGARFKCPYCPSESSPQQARKVFLWAHLSSMIYTLAQNAINVLYDSESILARNGDGGSGVHQHGLMPQQGNMLGSSQEAAFAANAACSTTAQSLSQVPSTLSAIAAWNTTLSHPQDAPLRSMSTVRLDGFGAACHTLLCEPSSMLERYYSLLSRFDGPQAWSLTLSPSDARRLDRDRLSLPCAPEGPNKTGQRDAISSLLSTEHTYAEHHCDVFRWSHEVWFWDRSMTHLSLWVYKEDLPPGWTCFSFLSPSLPPSQRGRDRCPLSSFMILDKATQGKFEAGKGRRFSLMI